MSLRLQVFFLKISYLFYFTNDNFRYYLQRQRDDRTTMGKEMTGRRDGRDRKGREEMTTTGARDADASRAPGMFFFMVFIYILLMIYRKTTMPRCQRQH
jgi:hypothetical protein